MAKKRKSGEGEQAARLAAHWRARALEFRRLARGSETSQFRRAAEQATAIAKRFERAQRFTNDFALVVDGEPVYAEIDGKPINPGAFPRRS